VAALGTTQVETTIIEDAAEGRTLVSALQEDAKADEEAGWTEV
jgi:hypothetical protein